MIRRRWQTGSDYNSFSPRKYCTRESLTHTPIISNPRIAPVLDGEIRRQMLACIAEITPEQHLRGFQ